VPTKPIYLRYSKPDALTTPRFSNSEIYPLAPSVTACVEGLRGTELRADNVLVGIDVDLLPVSILIGKICQQYVFIYSKQTLADQRHQ